jgi:transcriptional regulator with XRE-family HTH domain
MSKKTYKTLNELLKESRLDRRLTQEVVAKASELHREYIAHHENNLSFNPTIKSLSKWCGALGIKLSDCFALLGK